MKTAYDVVIRPIITESSMDLAAERKYAFKVDPRANKTEVKNAVEEIFDVDVAKVNIMNVNGKTKRLGRSVGKTSDFKKAIVTLTPDSKEIEIFQGL